MIRFTVRDVLWLMVVLALSIGWWIDADPDDGLRKRYRAASTSAREAWHRLEFLTGVLSRQGYSSNGMENHKIFENYGNNAPIPGEYGNPDCLLQNNST